MRSKNAGHKKGIENQFIYLRFVLIVGGSTPRNTGGSSGLVGGGGFSLGFALLTTSLASLGGGVPFGGTELLLLDGPGEARLAVFTQENDIFKLFVDVDGRVGRRSRIVVGPLGRILS